MKTFLFVIVDGGGNVSSQVSVARRLAVAGHSVHVLGDRTIEPEAIRAGCAVRPFVHAPQHNMRAHGNARDRQLRLRSERRLAAL